MPESYVHRIGRTARAGAGGRAISFCDDEERGLLKDIEKVIRQRIPVAERIELPPTPVTLERPRPPMPERRPQGRSTSYGGDRGNAVGPATHLDPAAHLGPAVAKRLAQCAGSG